MKFAWVMVAVAIAWGGMAQAAMKPLPAHPAIQVGAEAYVLHARRLNRDFLVVVTQPFTPPLPGQKLPAIYALDGGYDVAAPSSRLLASGGAMGSAFVVSIGYVTNAIDGQRFRNMDLMHSPAMQGDKMDGGGGAAFEAFLMEEVRPFIDAHYPTDPARAILFGHSLGGLFAANVLARDPDAYWGYVIASPSVWADPTLTERLRAAADKATGKDRRVFVTVGALERSDMTGGAASVAAALSGPGSHFQVRQQAFEGESHLTSYLRVPNVAFPFLLPAKSAQTARTAIQLETAVLDRYLGVYRLDEKRSITVTRQGDMLLGQLTGLPPVQMLADSATTFFATVADAQVAFDVGPDGRARGLKLRLNGSEATAPLVR